MNSLQPRKCQPSSLIHGEHGYLNVSGVRLEVKKFHGVVHKAPTLIFLHEGLGCIDMWRDFPEKLVQLTGCPALVYSRRGYGRSQPCELPRPLNYMHIEAMDVLPQLLAAAAIEDYILVGHSDGGSISLIHAGSCVGDGLRGIVTMAPHVFCETLSVRSIAQARQAFLDNGLRERLAKYHGENTDGAFWGWNGAWLDPNFMHWNIEEFLADIKVPQLVLQGEDDQYGTPAQVQAIAKQAGAPVAVCMLADCGHSPYKEQESLSLKLIVDFVTPLRGA